MENIDARESEETLDLDEYFRDVPPVEELAPEVGEFIRGLQKDPAYIADYAELKFLCDVIKAMQEQGLDQKQLAERMGKSPRYVRRVLHEQVKLTIERMAEFSLALGLNLRIVLEAPDAAASTYTSREPAEQARMVGEEHAPYGEPEEI